MVGKKKYRIRNNQPAGARSASGRLRARTARRVEPAPGVMRKRVVYGALADPKDCCDAVGRAYLAGLLKVAWIDDEDAPQRLLDTARSVAWKYWRIYGFATPDSLARMQPQRPVAPMDAEAEMRLEHDLNAALAKVASLGHDHRRAFDSLVIDLHPDAGPTWLDAIIMAHRDHRHSDARHYAMLEQALEALAHISGY